MFIKQYEWNDEKNQQLLATRGVGFEEIVVAIKSGDLLAVVNGKAPRYKHQRILVVLVDGYTYAVPFVEDDQKIFLKTIYPSRVLHKQFGRQ